MAAGEETSAEELQELQRAGLVDPIAKAQAEAKAMMAIEVERQVRFNSISIQFFNSILIRF